MKKVCKKCSAEKDLESFSKTASGTRRSACNTCRWKAQRASNPERFLETGRQRHKRYRDSDRARTLLRDTRKSDAKKNLEGNDLDIDYVRETISKPCSYCEGADLQITLDRIDNARAHTKTNTLPACLRCNLFRKDLPYEAWLLIVPAFREAKRQGLLKGWYETPIPKRKSP